VNSAERTSYGSTWYAESMEPAPECGRLAFDVDVDVCVVGGGLAGLTTARELALRGWSVALLEGRRIAWNASGRNDGFVLPGFAESLDKIIARVGRADAKALGDGASLCARFDRGAAHARRRARRRLAEGVEDG